MVAEWSQGRILWLRNGDKMTSFVYFAEEQCLKTSESFVPRKSWAAPRYRAEINGKMRLLPLSIGLVIDNGKLLLRDGSAVTSCHGPQAHSKTWATTFVSLQIIITTGSPAHCKEHLDEYSPTQVGANTHVWWSTSLPQEHDFIKLLDDQRERAMEKEVWIWVYSLDNSIHIWTAWLECRWNYDYASQHRGKTTCCIHL